MVASRVGGIQDQIEDAVTGRLVDPRDLDGFAGALVGLLSDPPAALRLGTAARSQVRDNFLGARHLAQYVDLMARLLRPG